MTEFISEPIVPDPGSFDTGPMTAGLAGIPRGFTWRGRHYVIEEVLEHVKQSSPAHDRPGGEMYLRRQQLRVRLAGGAEAVIYVERQARPGRHRWFLYTGTGLHDDPATGER